MASPALLSWIQSTVLIENDWGETGSGFLVTRRISGDRAKAFLITNKHVLNKDPQLRNEAKEIYIYVNMRDKDYSIVGQKGTFPLQYADSSPKWREHPDPDVDVLALDATSLILHFPQLEKKMANYSVFADQGKLQEYDIDIGDEVLVIGYPNGLKQGTTNYPLVRSGIIATRTGDVFQDTITDNNGKTRQRTVKGFLIDGATIPGSSGSPVILKPIIGRYIRDEVITSVAPALLLGIIAETYYSPVQTERWNIPSFASLGLAFSTDMIKETIELFF
jgi:hypothetical protein